MQRCLKGRDLVSSHCDPRGSPDLPRGLLSKTCLMDLMVPLPVSGVSSPWIIFAVKERAFEEPVVSLCLEAVLKSSTLRMQREDDAVH